MVSEGHPVQPAAPAGQYTDWFSRVAAFVIDLVPFALAYLIAAVAGSTRVYVFTLLGAIVISAWNRWMLGGRGQSVGKRLLRIRLVGATTGLPVGEARACARDLCHLVDLAVAYVGFFFPLWDDRRQTLADKIMRTVVVPA
ncbi:MAG: RDD family protein [Actinomycetota bacterium]|nr:RDD family protein [Actinomycetota bacterium]